MLNILARHLGYGIPMDIRALGLWAGMGGQTGGKIIFGIDNTEAKLYSIGDPLDKIRFVDIRTQGASIAIGLGGGFAACFIMAWGFPDSSEMNDFASVDYADFNFDFAVKGTGTYLKSLHEVGKAGRAIKHLGNVAEIAEKYSKTKFAVEQVIKNRESVFNPSKPGIISLPIPGASWGMELSIGARACNTTVLRSGLYDLRAALGR